MTGPKVSVVIPTFNRRDLLREAVDSVLAQSERDLECIVVDDGGTEPLDLPQDARIKELHHTGNLGKSAALNTGLDAARGEFVAFLDDDDVYLPDRLAAALGAHDGVDIVVCGTKWLGEERARAPRDLQGNVFDAVLDGITPHVDAVTVRRDAVVRFNTDYLASQDVEWWLRQAERTTVRTITPVGALIRRHDTVRRGNNVEARIAWSRHMLQERSSYFSSHPRAAAFRWFRIGLLSAGIGERSDARRAFVHSLRIRFRPRVAAHLTKLLMTPSRYPKPPQSRERTEPST